jgi:hypothetical protein
MIAWLNAVARDCCLPDDALGRAGIGGVAMGLREGLMALTIILVAAAPPPPAAAQTQQAANESAPKSWTMAAEVLARLETIKDYRALSALYDRKVAADSNWLQSAEGRAVDAQLKSWRRDAAAAVIVDDKDARILRYSIGGATVTDPGVSVADLEKSLPYRHTIAEAIAQNIMTIPLDPKVRAALAAANADCDAYNNLFLQFKERQARVLHETERVNALKPLPDTDAALCHAALELMMHANSVWMNPEPACFANKALMDDFAETVHSASKRAWQLAQAFCSDAEMRRP